MAALAAGDRPAVARAALGYAYVWYNFMPLARGTAVVGYVTLLGVFLAAGMPIAAAIPKARHTPARWYLSRCFGCFLLVMGRRARMPIADAIPKHTRPGHGACCGTRDVQSATGTELHGSLQKLQRARNYTLACECLVMRCFVGGVCCTG